MGYRGILLLACLCAGSASAATINVPADQGTIQAAIDAASAGDVVLVAPGTYYELLDFKGKAITVKSSGGAAVTILDGNHSGPIVKFVSGETNASILQGFTLTHAYVNDDGSAVQLSEGASPTIVDDSFVDNAEATGYWGGAIGGEGGETPVIMRDYFTGNTCGSQFFDSVVGFVGGASPIIADNVFIANLCPPLMLQVPAETTTQAQVYNNTMVGNRYGMLIYLAGPSSDLISNNLIAFNIFGGLDISLTNGAPMLTWSHNLVYGNGSDSTEDYQGVANQTGSEGNISSDPELKDRADGDVHLLYGSPAIDVGDGSVSQASTSDFYGDTRVFAGMPGDSSVVDIGAVEYHPPVVSGVAGTLETPPDTAMTGTLAASGADPAEPLSFAIASQPAHGTLTLTDAATGAIRYVPVQGYTGADVFTFHVTDPYGTVSDAATVQVTIPDAASVAYPGSFRTTQNAHVKGALTAVIAYAGQTRSFSIVSDAAHGTLSLDAATGTFMYTPAAAFAGADSFSFEVTDAFGLTSNVATESVIVADIPPKAYPASIAVTPGPHSGVLQATAAYAGQTLTYAILSHPAHGSVSLNSSTGAYTYRANPSYRGADSFTFQVVDQWGTASNSATVSIKIR